MRKFYYINIYHKRLASCRVPNDTGLTDSKQIIEYWVRKGIKSQCETIRLCDRCDKHPIFQAERDATPNDAVRHDYKRLCEKCISKFYCIYKAYVEKHY